MLQYVNWIRQYTKINIQNVFEIGANYAQDAEVLMKEFHLSPSQIYVFEAHPLIYAVFNKKSKMEFNLCNTDSENTGVSSLRNNDKWGYENKVMVDAIRMDDFMNDNNISSVDFLKLDVEGCNWEVLDGFGARLRDVKCIQVEAEHMELWEGEKLWGDIESILNDNGFVMVMFERKNSQSDSFWIQEKYLNS
jgi:hypothetical protein